MMTDTAPQPNDVFPDVTIGERLLALKEQSGLSLAEIAHRAGYAGASSIQKLFVPTYNPKRLSKKVARGLVKSFAGLGHPPIKEFEILAMASGDERNPDLGEKGIAAKSVTMLRDATQVIGVFDTIERNYRTSDGQTVKGIGRLENDEEEEIISTPQYLRKNFVYGLVVRSSNMWPRFEDGEIIFIQAEPRGEPGDDVYIVFGGKYGMIARLLAREPDCLVVSQFHPPATLRIPNQDAKKAYKILRRRDLLPPQDRRMRKA